MEQGPVKKGEKIVLKVSRAEKRRLSRAAGADHLPVSTWVRAVALKAAEQQETKVVGDG